MLNIKATLFGSRRRVAVTGLVFGGVMVGGAALAQVVGQNIITTLAGTEYIDAIVPATGAYRNAITTNNVAKFALAQAGSFPFGGTTAMGVTNSCTVTASFATFTNSNTSSFGALVISGGTSTVLGFCNGATYDVAGK